MQPFIPTTQSTATTTPHMITNINNSSAQTQTSPSPRPSTNAPATASPLSNDQITTTLRLARPPAITAGLVVPDANSIQRASTIAKARARAAIEASAVKAAKLAGGVDGMMISETESGGDEHGGGGGTGAKRGSETHHQQGMWKKVDGTLVDVMQTNEVTSGDFKKQQTLPNNWIPNIFKPKKHGNPDPSSSRPSTPPPPPSPRSTQPEKLIKTKDGDWIPVSKGPAPKWVIWYHDYISIPAHMASGPEADARRAELALPHTLKTLNLNQKPRPTWRNFGVHPYSVFMRGWTTFLLVTLVVQLVVMPLTLGFLELWIGLRYLTACLVPVWIVATFVDSRTGVKVESGGQVGGSSGGNAGHGGGGGGGVVKVGIGNAAGGNCISMDVHLMARRYFGKWFWFDLVVRFPYVFVIDACTDITTSPTLNRQLRLICLLNIGAVLRLVNTHENWSNDLARILRVRYNVNSNIVRTVKVLYFMILYWHCSSVSTFVMFLSISAYVSRSTFDR
jgi:hypothetical protein